MMYGYNEISPTMRMWLGVREGFCRLGFKSEDLYCEVAPNSSGAGSECLFVLRAQDKEFVIGIGPVDDPKAFEEEYHRVCERVNDGTVPDADLLRIWDESGMRHDAVPILSAMMNKGFKLPIMEEKRKREAN